MIDFELARNNMVDCQIRPSGVTDTMLLQSFEEIPRELFVPDKLQHISYSDENIDIGQGRFLMEPYAHSKLLQAADLGESDVVLDIGSGSGYSSAIISDSVTTVIALEINKRQMDKAMRLWEKLNKSNIVLVNTALGDGEIKHAPYSLIIINGAVSQVPKIILDQLAYNGRLIAIVKKSGQALGTATKYLKDSNGNISYKALFEIGVPYLKGFEPKSSFQF